MSRFIGNVSAYAYAVSKGYTGTEEEFAELMASYAEVGQTAVDAAESASASATASAQSASQASASEQGCERAVLDAASAAAIARARADEASGYAQTATTKASEAVGCVETAKQKATESAQSASQALDYKNDAESAQSASQTAQGLAESARDSAISAKNDAESARDEAQEIVDGIQAESAQIEQNTTDINELKSDLNQKANVDGSYDTLTAGNAKQLLSNLEQTDIVPYNYRTAGGSLEIGDREKLKKIVGGSLAVNQLAFELSSNNWSISDSVSYSDGIATAHKDSSTGGTLSLNLATGKKANVYAGHKYLFIATVQTVNGHLNLIPDGTSSHGSLGYTTYTSKTTIKYLWSCGTNDMLYFLLSGYTGSGVTSAIDFTVENPMCFDLTAMFGTTIADYVYSLETATAGAGVEWLKSHFPRIFDSGYIPYNVGTLEHVSGLSEHKMTGFNQWDEEWESGLIDGRATNITIHSKNFCKILPNTTYYATCGKTDGGSQNRYYLRIAFYDANKNFISAGYYNRLTFTTPANAAYFKLETNTSTVVYGNVYNHNICINLHWDGERDGEYEPYEEHSYPLDSDVTLRGIPKLDANNNLYYDGDEYEADGTVTRRYGIVDLGTLTWALWQNDANTFAAPFFPTISPSAHYILCTKYPALINGSTAWVAITNNDKIIYKPLNGVYILCRDTSYTDAATFKTAMSGVYLVYELATPATEEADPYIEIQNVSNWGTEEFVTTSLVPVGHETAYQPDLRVKIEVAPESPDTDGLYLMKRENGQNSYVAYLGELPTDPTTDGTYTLKATVFSGTVTKTWEADT